MALTLKKFHGPEIEAYINNLAELRIKVFRDYPYLYDGDYDYEKKYLQSYLNSPNSFLVLAFDKDQVVGATSAIPLLEDEPDRKNAFLQQGYDAKQIFYFRESVLLPAYRGNKIGVEFFKAREAEAVRQGFSMAAFAAVKRSPTDPRRPKDWHPLDKFWMKMGFVEHPEMRTEYAWKEIDEAAESNKPFTFWIKNL